MNAGISPARTVHSDLFAGDLDKCSLDPILDGVAARLTLPAAEALAVIGDNQFQPAPGCSARRPLVVRQRAPARGRPGWTAGCRDNFGEASVPPPGRYSRGFLGPIFRLHGAPVAPPQSRGARPRSGLRTRLSPSVYPRNCLLRQPTYPPCRSWAWCKLGGRLFLRRDALLRVQTPGWAGRHSLGGKKSANLVV